LLKEGRFATPDAGNGIAVAADVSLGGSSAGNYTVAQPTGLTANITVPVNVLDSGPRHQDAIASTVSLMSAMPLQGNTANAQSPSPRDGGDAPSSMANDALTGLNLSIMGSGITLPLVVQPGEERDDKN